MNIQTLRDLLEGDNQDHSKFYDVIKNYAKNTNDYLNQYDPKMHAVHKDLAKRPDKTVNKPEFNESGEQVRLIKSLVPVARISFALQKQITKQSAGILCGNPIKLESNDDIKAIQDVWDENKLDYKSKRICKLMMAETECAELWYKSDAGVKMMVLAPSYGDILHPIFDEFGDMIAFARSYEGKLYKADLGKEITVTFLEVFTDTDAWRGNNDGGVWLLEKKSHGFTKIPVIYYSQEFPEWSDVQEMIERLETLVSNLADTNDYFGSPTAVATGNILSYASKGESGKMVQLDGPGAKMEYLTWDQVPESTKLEIETLVKNIYSLTNTVNLSQEAISGTFGTAPSNYVVKVLFTGAHMKAAEHEENFGECIQRRLNFIKSFVGSDANVKPKFTYFIPKNEAEEVQVIRNAKDGGFLSQESSVKISPLTVNADDELTLVEGDAAKSAASIQQAKPMQS